LIAAAAVGSMANRVIGRGAHRLHQVRLAVREGGLQDAFSSAGTPASHAGGPGSHPRLTPCPAVFPLSFERGRNVVSLA